MILFLGVGTVLVGAIATPPSVLAQFWEEPQPSVWQSVYVQDGHFRLLLPGAGDRQTESVELLGQSVQRLGLVAEQSQHGAEYYVSWIELPPELSLRHQQQRTLAFETLLSNWADRWQGQLLQETNLTLAGYPGKQYRLRGDRDRQTYILTGRTFLMGSRVFQLWAVVPAGVEPDLQHSTKGFLQSFQLR